ncbi:histidine--tRNA ligase [uncultured Polaribacter sp.]|uniref:histidine--tRNA ligase n=1 Tax=uncultured Polaribacter sp. TaxID=174711 RepID=UPI00262DF9FC|nr:histidine--tRNA ligase [uncultured Polaribacter sp.]
MKPSIPKGTRDFSPTEVANRTYIINTIQTAFETYGFQPIETPSFENSSTLMGKYGEEGDRLIFKILNSGDFLKKADDQLLSEKNSLKVTTQISEKALRYDLTVPFARYVVQHQNDITFPFKRYQIQPVWRADRPQKGRFREFFQCDADVVGSKSLWQEVEFIQLYDTVFTNLGLEGTTIKMNNRKILSGIAEVIGAQDKLIDFTVALDKLDKIGQEKVEAEMLSKGITEEAIQKVQPLFTFNGTSLENLDALANMLATSVEGTKGVEELRFVINAVNELGLETANLEVDVTLARGLNYYTGAIFEVAAPQGVKMGSIGGGGRYDDLTGIFGLKDISGVGISFGLDRIYLVLEELGLFKSVDLPKPKVIFLNFDASTDVLKMKAIKSLRKNNIKSEFYPDLGESNKAQKRQWKYVTNRAIEFVVSKVEGELFTLKNMNSSEQVSCSLSELIDKLK